MSQGPAVKVEGAREVRATLRKLGAGTRDMSKVHRKVAALVIGPAQARTRHGTTGKLAGSYRVKASAAKAAVSSNVIYAPVQEFGWPRHNITPSHALESTVQDLAPTIAEAYQAYVKELVDRLNAQGAT